MWLGLRGFPGVQGGVEAHAERLCPALVELGCTVEVIVRSPYQGDDLSATWKGVRFKSVWSPRSKSLEAIVHSLLGVLYAGLVHRPDVLHIHAIGPAIVTPLARLLRLTVVVTHHGPDYEREKWGRLAKWMLRLGERVGIRWSNNRIAVSKVIQTLVRDKYGKDSVFIPNGVALSQLAQTRGALDQFDLESCKYICLVSRLVPEKRHLDLIAAFRAAQLSGWKLVLVGASDHPDEYTRRVLDAVAETPGAICTGFQTGLALRELYTHAGMFVLPSAHEGLPIAMLEALSYGLPVVASDIPANLEVGLPAGQYFPLGDVSALATRLVHFAVDRPTTEAREQCRRWVCHQYDWRDIAGRTLMVYQSVMNGQVV